jgi:aspartate oxidase
VDLAADYLIIGSGIAALRAVAELSPAGEVLILTKAKPEEGNTGHAQGGIAAVFGVFLMIASAAVFLLGSRSGETTR